MSSLDLMGLARRLPRRIRPNRIRNLQYSKMMYRGIRSSTDKRPAAQLAPLSGGTHLREPNEVPLEQQVKGGVPRRKRSR